MTREEKILEIIQEYQEKVEMAGDAFEKKLQAILNEPKVVCEGGSCRLVVEVRVV